MPNRFEAGSSERLAGLKAREPAAQIALRAELFGRVMATCRRILGDEIRAEQEAEDIWMDFLFDEIDAVRSEAAMAGFLKTMAVRRCVRAKTRLGRQVPALASDVASPLDSEGSLAEAVDQRRELARLARCVRKLDARHRRLIRLRYHKDMTFEAIGKHLGATKQYAAKVLGAAIDGIRACMGVAVGAGAGAKR